MKVAIVHYWLVGMRGGERVLEALCRMFPDADVFTHVLAPSEISETILRHNIETTFISRLPFSTRFYQAYLPLMPRALEELDMREYDLILSSEAGPAKGIIAPPHALHLCYCHSPMRYLWDQYPTYRAAASVPARVAMSVFAPGLRRWDTISALRPDSLIANSRHVAARIRKYWGRQARVVHPPVAVERFSPVPAQERGDYYLWLGELAPYKRPDLALKAFSVMRRRLLVIGGPDKTAAALARQAGPTIEFLGKLPFDRLRDYLSRCRALIFPGEEDFGIVPVEAMAAGRPVIAFGRGGVLDSVQDRYTGLLFQEQSVASLIAAVEEFERTGLEDISPDRLVAQAARFRESRFREEMQQVIEHAAGPPDASGRI